MDWKKAIDQAGSAICIVAATVGVAIGWWTEDKVVVVIGLQLAVLSWLWRIEGLLHHKGAYMVLRKYELGDVSETTVIKKT